MSSIPITTGGLVDAGKTLGVPFVVLLVVLTQLGPKIDHGIMVADRVDAELQFIAARGCGPVTVVAP